MRRGERILLDYFELEATDDGYRAWAPDDPSPVADIAPLPEQCLICMLRSGFEFRCASLTDAEHKIAACRSLGL